MCTEKKPLWQIPGQYEYEGIQFGPHFTPQVLNRVKIFPLHASDVLLQGYPKSGTTWHQQLIWLVLNNADTDTAQTIKIRDRMPLLEGSYPLSDRPPAIDMYLQKKPPRVIKTHLQYNFFEETFKETTPKVIVIMRNPKDLLVSFYHFYRMNAELGNFKGPWSEFYELFEAKALCFGDWFDNVLGWWKHHNDPNILFLKYEDSKKDLQTTVRKIAKHLNKDLTDDQMVKIVEYCQFENMKKNPTVNKEDSPDSMKTHISSFMRKGTVGDWKNHFTMAQNEKFDALFEEKMKGSGLNIDFEM